MFYNYSISNNAGITVTLSRITLQGHLTELVMVRYGLWSLSDVHFTRSDVYFLYLNNGRFYDL